MSDMEPDGGHLSVVWGAETGDTVLECERCGRLAYWSEESRGARDGPTIPNIVSVWADHIAPSPAWDPNELAYPVDDLGTPRLLAD